MQGVLNGIGARLSTIDGLQVFDRVPSQITPPTAIVALPETVTYDLTMGRGADECTVPVFVLVSRMDDESARDALAPYISGIGASSVKVAVEGDVTLAGAADTARVTSSSSEVLSIAGVDYLSAQFNIHVVA